jgi:hypothetical protein
VLELKRFSHISENERSEFEEMGNLHRSCKDQLPPPAQLNSFIFNADHASAIEQEADKQRADKGPKYWINRVRDIHSCQGEICSRIFYEPRNVLYGSRQLLLIVGQNATRSMTEARHAAAVGSFTRSQTGMAASDSKKVTQSKSEPVFSPKNQL